MYSRGWIAGAVVLLVSLEGSAQPSRPRTAILEPGIAAASGSTDVSPRTDVQAARSPVRSASYHELGGHEFPLAVFVPTALMISYFSVRAGVEYHRVPGYRDDLSFFGATEQITDLATIHAAEQIDAAIRLHDRVAVFGNASGLVRVGANERTLLGTGADYTYGFDFGAVVKLFRLHDFQLSVRPMIGYSAGQQAGILELFQDIGALVRTSISEAIDTQGADLPERLERIENSVREATPAMLTPFRGVEYGGSINGAKAFGRSFGLQFALGLFASSATYDIPVFDAETSKLSRRVRSVGKLWPRVSIAFDADGGAEFGVPIDLMLEYTLTHVSANSSVQGEKEREEGSEAEHVIALGVYYSGLVDLQLGVTGYASFGEHPMTGAHGVRSGDPYGIGGLFVFRYLH